MSFYGNDEIVTKPPTTRVWYASEESYLKLMRDTCQRLSHRYFALHKKNHSLQTRLRIPSIVFSSFSGAASFGTTTFPAALQRYVNITVGIINVGIAMLQAYESYLKIGEIVAKSLSVSNALKKIAEDIECELFIPVSDRDDDGKVFLRDCFNRFQTTLEPAPPLDDNDAPALREKIQKFIHRAPQRQHAVNATSTKSDTEENIHPLPPHHVGMRRIQSSEE